MDAFTKACGADKVWRTRADPNQGWARSAGLRGNRRDAGDWFRRNVEPEATIDAFTKNRHRKARRKVWRIRFGGQGLTLIRAGPDAAGSRSRRDAAIDPDDTWNPEQ